MIRRLVLAAVAMLAAEAAQAQNCPGGQCPIPARPAAVTVKVDWYVSPSDPTGWYFEYAGQWYRSPSSDAGVLFTHRGVQYLAAPYVKKAVQ